MHFDLTSVVTIVTALCAWSLAGLYCYRSERRRRRWQTMWEEFRYSHRGLDRELNLIWHRQGGR